MAAFALALPALALLLLAAHFVHAGLWPAALICLTLLALLSVRRRWAARTLQFVLAIGAGEWILTAMVLARMRQAHGQPFTRLLVILGAVTVFTVLAALVFELPALRGRFPRAASPPRDPSGDAG